MPFLARAHIRQVLCSQGRLLLVSRKRFLCAPASNMAVAVTDEEILKKIGNNPEENVATKEKVELKSFWSEKPAVIFFMRRFG